GRRVPRAGRPQSAGPARRAARPGRSVAAGTRRGAGDDAPGRRQAPRRARGRGSRRHVVARAREAPPPQRRPDQRRRRPVDPAVRPGAGADPRRPPTGSRGDRHVRRLRLRHLHPHDAGEALAGADRPGVHREVLRRRRADVGLGGRLEGPLVDGRRGAARLGPARPRGRPAAPAVVHLAQLPARDAGDVRLERRAPGRAAAGEALEGHLRHRAGGAGREADRHPRRLRARQRDARRRLPGLAGDPVEPEVGAGDGRGRGRRL
ncbi:MAG: Transcriptional regulator, ArsR family / Ligand-binding SRPBCC domain protein family, partial [uncultured Actinomycetospora sp.]